MGCPWSRGGLGVRDESAPDDPVDPVAAIDAPAEPDHALDAGLDAELGVDPVPEPEPDVTLDPVEPDPVDDPDIEV